MEMSRVEAVEVVVVVVVIVLLKVVPGLAVGLGMAVEGPVDVATVGVLGKQEMAGVPGKTRDWSERESKNKRGLERRAERRGVKIRVDKAYVEMFDRVLEVQDLNKVFTYRIDATPMDADPEAPPHPKQKCRESTPLNFPFVYLWAISRFPATLSSSPTTYTHTPQIMFRAPSFGGNDSILHHLHYIVWCLGVNPQTLTRCSGR